MRMRICYQPIGYVDNIEESGGVRFSHIIIKRKYIDGLMDIEKYSKYLYIIFHLHLNEGKGYELVIHPKGDVTQPLRGVFATRSPYRPNLIGLTIVELIEVKGETLIVRDLDAVIGTPILDIKPVEDKIEMILTKEKNM
jgi:tRNA-Thr(GGU) m(6)t(6)A37 methyltransferase TsaA